MDKPFPELSCLLLLLCSSHDFQGDEQTRMVVCFVRVVVDEVLNPRASGHDWHHNDEYDLKEQDK